MLNLNPNTPEPISETKAPFAEEMERELSEATLETIAAGQISYSDISFTTSVNKASPKLML